MTTYNKNKLYGIGIGPGDAELLTIKAVKALGKADIICVPKSKEQASTALSIVSGYLDDDVTIEHMEFPMSKDRNVRIEARKKNAEIIQKHLRNNKTVAFLTLGDPMLYSTYGYILEYLDKSVEIETIPGIYSFSAISSLLSVPLVKDHDKLSVICSFDESAKNMLPLSESIVCMKICRYKNELYDFLKANEGFDFYMISEAGKEGQQVFTNIEVLKGDISYFSTAILKRVKY
ncbi:precorrin-2 C(20)-methyltransferase [Plebeiibacterium marinum]|uniref:Precorrin-2 C(20)-methyltransferase n=1 Tax=Plebeiibacterium marinum TaxID=2992111 RepID=A0AAE3MGJ5_9BACT|nr:precorrin-2 C(20)-methyltransferase [Plebeiobacterium marinum]MCW3807179.1 precorrin-2 C(20)-methyltransferase [Plebeiobacterium marinum]